MKRVYSFVIVLCLCYMNTQSQSTFEQVHAIFQAKCTGACHAGAQPSGNLDLSGTTTQVYNRLVNVDPTNPAALNSGYKRITPGYPFRSSLMRKINHGLDPQNDLTQAEGNNMPNNSDTLKKEEIELVRQWIIFGAKDTGITYNANLIHDYYNGLGVEENTAPLTPAQEGKEGYQVKFGPIFLQPLGEFEFLQVYNPNLSADVEITEMHAKLPPNAHHFVMRSVTQAGANVMGVAPLVGSNFNTQILVYQYTKFIGIWQFTDDLVLPAGTAHFQDSAEALMVNLHMHNYSGSQILACSAYLNVYTQPAGSGAVEMKSDLSTYGGTNPFLLQIPPTGLRDTLSYNYTVPGETRYYWNIQSHTHQWGKSFNMFKRNSDGSRGAQFYDGNYNENYTFNQGYYDYTHPAVETFDPLMEIDMNNGLIFEASYLNNGPNTVSFALTTEGEMFVTYFQYTNELPTAINKVVADNSALQVYPNPSNGSFNLSYNIVGDDVVSIALYNNIGAMVKTIYTGTPGWGKHNLHIDANEENLSAGIYYIHLIVNGSATIKKVIVMNR